MKLNIDISSLGNLRITRGGGLIRDHRGSQVKGFTCSIGVVSPVDDKLWALRDGLRFCISLNLLAVDIELDAKVVLGWITEEFNSNLHHASFIWDCRTLIDQILQVRTKHCYCEANKCMDALARMRSSSSQDFMLFDSLLVDLYMLYFIMLLLCIMRGINLLTLALFSFF